MRSGSIFYTAFIALAIFAAGAHAEQTTSTSVATSETTVIAADTTATALNTTITLPSGVQYVNLKLGDGPLVSKGTGVRIHYRGTLLNGKPFDSSRDWVVPVPFKFKVGAGRAIDGMDQGVEGMRVGARRVITVPPALGYGARGVGDIPPNSTLVFDVEVVDIEKN